MWQGTTIAQITSMELYTVDYVYNQIKETHIGGHKSERLQKEVFNKVQKIKKLNRGKNFKCGSTKKKYFDIFEGKLFCKANQNSNIVKEKKLKELLLDNIKNIPVKVDT